MNNRFLPNGKLTPLVYALGIAMCLAAIESAFPPDIRGFTGQR
jgi:hypothetical protein